MMKMEIKREERVASAVQRLMARLDAIRDWQLFVFTMLWVIAGGLLLQLVILPYVVPQAHWGHGLIRDLDSLGYHVYAAQQAERIHRLGWSAWELRPEGQSPAGLASIFYVLIYPEPWSVLPFNALLFATAVTAVRRLLATLVGSDGAALLATLPFFVFPSFVPIWGQLQKDVTNGAGLALVLCALVLAAHPGRRRGGVAMLYVLVVLGMVLIWVSRPYMMTIAAVAAVGGGTLALLDPRCQRIRLVTALVVMLVVTALGVQRFQDRPLPKETRSAEAWRTDTGEPAPAPPARRVVVRRQRANSTYVNVVVEVPAGQPLPPDTVAILPAGQPLPPDTVAIARAGQPTPLGTVTIAPGVAPARYGHGAEGLDEQSPVERALAFLHLPRPRLIDPTMPTYAPCAPEPKGFVQRALFSLCLVREGFIGDAARHHAGSGFDYRIRMRSLSDLVAYLPRAIAFSVLQPAPDRWGGETTPIGHLATLFIPFEMGLAYLAFALVLALARQYLRRPEFWAVLVSCVIYTSIFAYTMPQLGTLYRMRAFAFAMIVSMALAAVFATRVTARR